MTEKATERPWRYEPEERDCFDPSHGHYTSTTGEWLVFGSAAEIEPLAILDGTSAKDNAELIVKAVNNYDELASIAGEMAGALEPFKQRFEKELEEMRKLVGPIPAIHARNIEALLATLSRYTAFMEGKG